MDGYRTIIEAAEANDITGVQHFLDQGVPINSKDRRSRGEGIDKTALGTAVYFKYPEMVEFLLKQGAIRNIAVDAVKDRAGENTALHCAVLNGDVEMLNVLLMYSPISLEYVNKQKHTPLHALLAHFILNLHPPGQYLRAITLQACIKCLNLLLRHNARHDKKSLQRRFPSCYSQVEQLLQLAKQASFDYEIMHDAAEVGDIAAVKFFLDQSVDIEEKRTYRLHGKDLNEVVYGWDTPLIAAANYKQFTMVAFLLSKGADPNAQDSCGNTALHYAGLNGDVRSINSLLAHPRIAVNLQNKQYHTPLNVLLESFDKRYRAMSVYDFERCINQLHAKGAIVDIQDSRIYDTLTAIMFRNVCSRNRLLNWFTEYERQIVRTKSALATNALFNASSFSSPEHQLWNARRIVSVTQFLHLSAASIDLPEAEQTIMPSGLIKFSTR